jgi:uncharacterized protein involved in tellurium resistance
VFQKSEQVQSTITAQQISLPQPQSGSVVVCSLLVGELGLSHLLTAQDNVEHALNVAEQLLVGGRGAALKVGNDSGRAVALGCEVLLRHGRALVVLGLGASLGDSLTDCNTDGLGFDDVVGAIDLGEALTLAASAL